MAQLLVMVITKDNTDDFIKYFGIDRERKELAKVSMIKNRKAILSLLAVKAYLVL